MNWGSAIVWLMAAECLAAAIVYACRHDWTRSVYWLLVAGIDVIVPFIGSPK